MLTLRKSHCIPETRNISPDKPQFITSTSPIMLTPSTRSKKLGFQVISF